MASPVVLSFCWRNINNDTQWHEEENLGYCSYNSIKSEWMFHLGSHVLLALVSALYVCLDHTDQNSTSSTLKKSSIPEVRLVIAVSSALVHTLGFLRISPIARSGPDDMLLDGTSAFAWLQLSIYTWKLRQQSVRLARTHKPLVLAWSLTFVSQCMRLSMVTKQLLNNTSTTFEQEGVIVASGMLQVLYLLTLLPSPRHTVLSQVKVGRSAGQSVDDGTHEDTNSLEKPSAGAEHLGIAAEHAGLLSRLTFSWAQDIMRKGAAGQLKKASDVYKFPEDQRASRVEDYFSRFYPQGSTSFAEDVFNSEDSVSIKDLTTTKNDSIRSRRSNTQARSVFQEKAEDHKMPRFDNAKRISLCRAILRAFGFQIFILGIFKLVSNTCKFASPLLLHALLSFLENSDEPVKNGYLYAFGLCVATALQTIVNSQFHYRIVELMMKLRVAVKTSLYRKTLAVGARSLSTFTTGQINNLMNVDANRISRISHSINDAWSVLLETVVTLFLLYQQVGVSFLIGVGCSFLILPLSKFLLAKIVRYHRKLMKQKDSRVKMMHEILNGMRVIKFFAWEGQFKKEINGLRSEELRSLKGIRYFCALNHYVCSTSPILIALLTFTSYTLLGNELTAAKVFTSLALFSMLQGPVNGIPWVLNCLLEAWVSFKRIQKYMDIEETDLTSYYLSGNKHSAEKDKASALKIKDGCFYWEHPLKKDDEKKYGEKGKDEKRDNKENETKDSEGNEGHEAEEHPNPVKLQEIDLNISKGQLVGVIGKVGTGKTSLLSSILADMVKEGGDIRVAGLRQGFGVATQEPWLQHATVKENILFGREYNPERYRQVVEACALLEDIKILPAGDETEIGEKGITLSGGQKARVALARAVYQDSEIYLLDDPLAAVDAQVGQHIFSKCIMGLLRHKTRILCTHHTRFLVDADVVVVMEDFKILKKGPPSEVFDDPKYSGHLKSCKLETEGEEQVSESEVKGCNGDGKKVVDEEEKEEGVVKSEVYQWYWNAMGNTLASIILLTLFLMQVTGNMSDWWLSHWVTQTKSIEDTVSSAHAHQPSTTQYINMSMEIGSEDQWFPDAIKEQNAVTAASLFYLKVYAGVIGTTSLFTLLSTFLFVYGAIRAATTIHDGLLNSILSAPISFFNATPVGRIIHRFTDDVFTIDFHMTFALHHLLTEFLSFVGAVILTAYSLPWFIICLIPLAVICYYMQDYYRKTSRELRRFCSISNSAICSHFSETLSGLTVIKGMRATERFRKENRSRLELHQRAWFCSDAVSHWLFFRLNMLGVAMVTVVSVTAVLQHQFQTSDPGLVGLAVTYALANTHRMIAVINTLTEIEKQMISTERVHNYTTAIPNEPQGGMIKAPPLWPKRGVVKFSNVQFSYREDHPKALSGVDFETRPGEKIGIVGRTGSGKSTLFLVLFRMVKIQEGSVTIDGVDLSQLSLEDVRSKLAIIPQDPFLFSASVRKNLDPVGQFSDSELWSVLKKCHLEDVVSRMGGLDAQAGEGGKQFSTGQKQLVCLARAMLTRAQVLCIDEATASVDMATDDLLQQAIKEEFKDNTILTIAHRLNTLKDSDRILVMDGGKVAKFEKTTVTTVEM
ncbi:ATP-binding cassette sub-family C member 10-like [Lytechinus variegatus]|uniref:ATP-binding cassette sub-family C member 10-like n=1 Tax=Lytechinus variegatus TaxID=7654 RepID=UPI001BB2BA18|nr:ATP-binding cassette sub-family C member 10-like [Lytechinus variegatus]